MNMRDVSENHVASEKVDVLIMAIRYCSGNRIMSRVVFVLVRSYKCHMFTMKSRCDVLSCLSPEKGKEKETRS